MKTRTDRAAARHHESGRSGERRRPTLLASLGGWVLWLLMGACTFDGDAYEGLRLRCTSASDCPDERACLLSLGLCVETADECVLVDRARGIATPAPDGNLCGAGICAKGTCIPPRCGDGVVTAGEECDDGEKANADHAACTTLCVANRCGDGFLQVGSEACDDGNDVDGDGCDRGCIPSACGNGVQAPQEECDDGNLESGDQCDENCTLTRCGNGVRTGSEGCDDGNDVDGDGCDTNCRPTGCGNASVAGAEECDDGNDIAEDGCTNACTLPRCGDGLVQVGEQCDDGNTTNEDGCRSDCRLNVCGDGVLDPNHEECDDGNQDNNDECLRSCDVNRCGDGHPSPATEECDDGNADNDDGCLALCVLNTCGDGFLDPLSEECDDGNAQDDDTCTSGCTLNRCGDGFLLPGIEQCDDGNQQSGDGCRSDCGKIEVCGDGVVDANEACDDANDNRFDGCDACANQTWQAEWLVGGRLAPTDADLRDLGSPQGVVSDASGRIYIADTGNHQVLRRDPDGRLWVVVGIGLAGNSDDEVRPGTRVALREPRGLAVDGEGNLYIADSGNHRIRKLRPDGDVETVAGTGEWGSSGDGGPAREARIGNPYDLAFDGLGRLWIAELGGRRIRRINGDGTILTAAGGGDTPLDATGYGILPASDASLSEIFGLTVDAQNRVVFAETYAHRVLRLESNGTLSIVAGTGVRGEGGDEGLATSAQLAGPTDVAFDASGSLYIADQFNHRIRRVRPQGEGTAIIDTVAGGPPPAGTPAEAWSALESPRSLALDHTGSVVFVEAGGHRLGRLAPSGGIEVLAGTGQWGFATERIAATTAFLEDAIGIAVHTSGEVYIAERGRHLVRRIRLDGMMETVAGTYFRGYAGDGGDARRAALQDPRDVALAPDGSLFIADSGNHCVRHVEFFADGSSRIETAAGICGQNEQGSDGDGGLATAARLYEPYGIGVGTDPDGVPVLWIADTRNQRIRRVRWAASPDDRIIDTVVGGPGAITQEEGATGSTTQVSLPIDVAADAEGNPYFAEYGRSRVRRLDGEGRVYTVAGTGAAGFAGDGGLAAEALLDRPFSLAFDGEGRLCIADMMNLRVRRVYTSSEGDAYIDTIAGNGSSDNSGDGDDARNASVGPVRIAFDAAGDLWTVGLGRVRRIALGGADFGVVSTQAGELHPAGWTGPADQALLFDAASLTVAGDYLFIAGGYARRIQALDLRSRTMVAAVGYPRAAPSVQGFAAYAPLLDAAVGVTWLASEGQLLITDAESPEIRSVQLTTGADETIGAPSTWTHTRLPQRRGARVDRVLAERSYNAGQWVTFPAVDLSAGHFVEVIAEPLAAEVAEGESDLYVAFDGAPAEDRYDCRSTEPGVTERCQLAVPPGATTLVVSVRVVQDSALRVRVMVDDEPPFGQLRGISPDADGQNLLVADAAAHCILRLAPDGQALGVVYGTCGVAGSDEGLLRGPAHALASPKTGAIFIADTGNRRVLRVAPEGSVDRVLGDGTPSSAGEGTPARAFAVQSPRQLALDDDGNLYVAGGNALRQVTRRADAPDADGGGTVKTLFDRRSPLLEGGRPIECIEALAFGAGDALYVGDACEGVLWALHPETQPLNP